VPTSGGYAEKPLTKRQQATALHHWFLVERGGMTVEQVAAKYNLTVFKVQESIDYVKEWQSRNSLSFLETKAIEVVMSQMDSIGKVHQRGMQAEKVVFVNQKTGRVKKMPDIAMQLKAVAEVRNLMATVQPKGPALQLNQQNNFGMPGGGGFAPGRSFEQILRQKREAKGLVNSQDAEIIEAEMTHAESLADEFKDLGGEDDGDEEEDDGE